MRQSELRKNCKKGSRSSVDDSKLRSSGASFAATKSAGHLDERREGSLEERERGEKGKRL